MGGLSGHFSFQCLLSMLFGAAVLTVIVVGTPLADADGDESTPDQPVYQYTDRNGVMAFTNDLSRIPAEYRAAAKAVNLPPLFKTPDSNPQPAPEPPSLVARMRSWNAHLSLRDRLLFYGLLPAAVVLLSVLSVLRRRTDNASLKFALWVGMVGILLLSVSVGYLMFLRMQAATLTGEVMDENNDESDLVSSLKQQAIELNTRTTNVLDRFGNAGDQRAPTP
jgi:hypothetical protein